MIKIIMSIGILLSMSGYSLSINKLGTTTINNDTIIGNYTNIATANYKDAVKDAENLEIAINNFAKNPNKLG